METVTIALQSSEIEFKSRLKELDLEPIKAKLLYSFRDVWDLEKLKLIEKEYKKFLFLCFKYQEKAIVPSKLVDDFWHQHILDTGKYKDDCFDLFGYFLHHFPYFGMRDKKVEEVHEEAIKETQELYKKEFGGILSDGFTCQGVPTSNAPAMQGTTEFNLRKEKRPTIKDVLI